MGMITMCAWFALCSRPAVTTTRHSVLGQVPICEPCMDWLIGSARDPS